jgi:nucleoside-specific outer membrane channel protein Tsx
MNRLLASIVTLASLLHAIMVPALADDAAEWVQWHSENVQILRGNSYELGASERTIITLEHANRWRYGDTFLFTDITLLPGGQTAVYGEFQPRLSLSRLTRRAWSAGAISDVYIAGMYERGEGHTQRYLLGIGTDWVIPGFRFFKANIYWRDDPNRSGDTLQATLAWNRNFEIAGHTILAEGFADITGAEGNGVAHQMIVPRFLWDVGAEQGNPGRILLGIEHQFWNNKFGVDGASESVTQIQLKWVLN